MLEVKAQYERWPYPKIPLIATIPREQLWQINFAWLAYRCHQPHSIKSPKIWIAGCGTFQPYAFSQANPNAEILATDLSKSSLNNAETRCRLHGKKNVRFETVDLEDEGQYPDEQFDLIECFGVLMCVKDPLKVLKKLARRLKPHGILRIMVYPHYGRQRVFQIQRLAKLLGINVSQRSAPSKLKAVMASLPKSHPLSYAFFSYKDSKNEAGIVDAFLHAHDRAFTGYEISEIIDAANLSLAMCVHRPWGQPRVMSAKLNISKTEPGFWLHYLDLWQSLRTNFILCLTKNENGDEFHEEKFQHPLFKFRNQDLKLRDKARLLRLSVAGTTLDSKTHEEQIKMGPQEFRKLLKGDTTALGMREPILGRVLHHSEVPIRPNKHEGIRLGESAVNPFYAHLFDAFSFAEQWRDFLGEGFPNLNDQMARWRRTYQPLENDTIQFGLTPFATYEQEPKTVEEQSRTFWKGEVVGYADVRLASESRRFIQVENFLKDHGIVQSHLTPAEMRELWVLLFSYQKVFGSIWS